MGPLLVPHGAAPSPGAQVEPAGGRRDEVPHAAGGPVAGRGESGPGPAAGEAGVCNAVAPPKPWESRRSAATLPTRRSLGV